MISAADKPRINHLDGNQSFVKEIIAVDSDTSRY